MWFKRLLLTFSLILLSPVAHAEVKSLQEFQRIPILDSGRVKPLDTYARNMLLQFSGKDTFERKPAIQWLARLLFNPDSTKNDHVFLINNPDLVASLGIAVDPHRRYSFDQLQQKYPKLLELDKAAEKITEKERSVIEHEIIRVVENLRAYARISHEILFAFSHDDFKVMDDETAKMLNLPKAGEAYSFLDIALTADQMRDATKGLEHKPLESWTPQEREIMGLLSNLFHWSMNYKDLGLSVIPSRQQPSVWLSPWDAISSEFQDETIRQQIVDWQNMAVAFKNGEQAEFDLAARAFLQSIDEKLTKKFDLELAYYGLRPFFVAKFFYILVLVFFVISFMSAQRIWYTLAWGSLILGFTPHLLGLFSRVIIMARPPVTSLYETFIFVSFITVFLGVLIERINKNWLGLVVSGISGTALLFIASKYSAEGDTLKMLIAVLNSNFWLGTHVLTITMGYGATCVAGLIGHIWLIQAARKQKPAELENTHRILLGILGLALTLTFLGTNLGGIWADQSWGRFWGWDPKENGALMIVIWTAMLFHAKVSKMISSLGMAIGAVVGMMVVMWAWFGVNLLSIGLHSYGFTSGIAGALAIYAICEIMFLFGIFWLIKRP